MRKILLALLMLTGIAIHAQGVSEEQARLTAAGFIATKTHNSGVAKAPAMASALQLAWAPILKKEDPEIYVFNLPNNGGFVIVSGEEATSSQILGWSDKGNFDPENLPPALQYLSARYIVDIAKLRDNEFFNVNVRSGIRRAPTSGYGEVKPLLTTQWNQGYGYNDLLPDYPTGCVATAMAQIMNYHQWPKHGYGKHTNMWMAGRGIDQTVDFSQSVYDWDGMNNNESAAISKLMYDFGCAVNMMYTTSESGADANDALKALVTNFGYDEGAIKTSGKSDDILRNELREGRPVFYLGQDTITEIVWIDGSHWIKKALSGSHAFVCDGFSDDGLFHFNFGWGGHGDGYYTLDVIRPNGDSDLKNSFAPIGYIIYGIKPGEKTCVDGVWYDLDDQAGTATIGSGGYEGDVFIPEKITYQGKTYTVNAMYPYAFAERRYDKNLITNLVFNAAIEEFPADAIRCGDSPGHVEHATFGGGVRRIADRAFYGIEELLTLTLGDNVESIGKEAFMGCKVLGQLNLGKSITDISDRAFNGCNIMELDVPATVKRIGKYAVTGLFYKVKFNGPIELDTCAIGPKDQIYSLEGLEHCTRIAYMGLNGISGTFTPNPAAKYDSYAISGKFDKIVIPAGCTDYDYTTALETREFYVEPGNPNFASSGGALYTKDMKTLLAQPLLTTDYTLTTDRFIPMGVTEITEQPVKYNYSYLYLPPSMRHINASAICLYNIRHVYCMSATPPTFNEDKQGEIQINAKLHVPVGCEEAYAAAPVWSKFANIVGDMHNDGRYIYLHDANSDQVSVIGRNAEAFTGHDFMVPSVTEINGEKLPVKSVEASVFQGDPNVESVTLGAFVEFTNAKMFMNCSNLKRVKFMGEIYDLSNSVFENCTSLVDVDIDRNNYLSNLGERVFAGCTSLKYVDLTSQEGEYMNFGKSVFEGCTSLRGVKGISDFYRLPARTFANSGIETFHVGAGMYSFDYDDPFEGCTQLHSFTVAADHPSFYVADGILYKCNEYSSYPWSMYVCPPKVKDADGQVTDRTVINISERCDQLNNQLPASVKEVVIPATMKHISSGTFSYTNDLKKLTVLRDDPNFVDNNTFWAVYTKATLQVPKGRKTAYAEHAEWGKFTDIVEIDPDDYPSPEAIKEKHDDEQNIPDDPNVGNALSILMQDGTTHFIRLAQQPVITIGGASDLNISGQNISLSLPISDIRYYRFDTYDIAGIVEVGKDAVELDFTGDDLNVDGLKHGQKVTLYDLQGRLIRSSTVNAEGNAILKLSGLPTAVYVLKVNDTTYKILKK